MAKSAIGWLRGALPLLHVGKVRETYQVPGHPDLLLIVATDRVSTHNVVHRSVIPQKGVILTALTIHWLREVFSDIPNHLVASGQEIYQYLPRGIGSEFDTLHHRAMVVRRLVMTKVEFIHRRYLVEAGSLYKAYKAGKDPYGLCLPKGLPVMHRFDPPIFTPTDKSTEDLPMSTARIEQSYPKETQLTKELFLRGERYLNARGIALLDSKFEASGGVLADEMLTMDSSRFANSADVKEGEDPPWLDKQILRDEVEKLYGAGPKSPVVFPQAVVDRAVSQNDTILHSITDHSVLEWIAEERFNFHI